MLVINLNDEYKIKIEKGKEFKNSIFKEVYLSASKNVAHIISKSNSDSMYDDFNNLIAFIGERGKGKSSSMISFRDALINVNDSKLTDFFENNDDLEISFNNIIQVLRKTTFAELDIIDPSLFRGNESLFEIILAKMFSKFQDYIKKSDSKIADEVRRTLIKLFQNVFENLQIINCDRKELYKQETIEVLSKLATSSNLRDCFKDLVEYYLEHFEKKQFLVICVDDFDLFSSGTYEMLEDIRQFLIQNKIIILVACKIEQLRESILNNLYKEFEFLVKYQSPEIDENKLITKTEKYLEKLIPFEKRLELPNLKMF